MANVLIVAYLLIVLALIAVILLQRSEGGGLGMGSNSDGLITRPRLGKPPDPHHGDPRDAVLCHGDRPHDPRRARPQHAVDPRAGRRPGRRRHRRAGRSDHRARCAQHPQRRTGCDRDRSGSGRSRSRPGTRRSGGGPTPAATDDASPGDRNSRDRRARDDRGAGGDRDARRALRRGTGRDARGAGELDGPKAETKEGDGNIPFFVFVGPRSNACSNRGPAV